MGLARRAQLDVSGWLWPTAHASSLHGGVGPTQPLKALGFEVLGITKLHASLTISTTKKQREDKSPPAPPLKRAGSVLLQPRKLIDKVTP